MRRRSRLLVSLLLAGVLYTLYEHLETTQRTSKADLSRAQAPPFASHVASPAAMANRSASGVSRPQSRRSKMVVVASLASEDTHWAVAELPPGWDSAVYIVDRPEYPHSRPARPGSLQSPLLSVPRNKGHEAGVYLHHIIAHYEILSDVTVFLHAHRDGHPRAWHVDNEKHSNPLGLRRLRISAVVEHGFVNLRCLTDPGCPDDIKPFRDPPDLSLTHEHAMPAALEALFGWDKEHAPRVIATPCCSQFAVSRDQIRTRSKAEYERYYRWLLESELDDAVSGRVMEYLWHIIFGKPPVWCLEAWECYCLVYGISCPKGLEPDNGRLALE